MTWPRTKISEENKPGERPNRSLKLRKKDARNCKISRMQWISLLRIKIWKIKRANCQFLTIQSKHPLDKCLHYCRLHLLHVDGSLYSVDNGSGQDLEDSFRKFCVFLQSRLLFPGLEFAPDEERTGLMIETSDHCWWLTPRSSEEGEKSQHFSSQEWSGERRRESPPEN